MSNPMFDTSPLGGESVPYKDLPEEYGTEPVKKTAGVNGAKPGQDKTKQMKLFMIGVSAVLGIVIIVLVVVLVMLANRPGTTILVQASPSPSPTPALTNEGIPPAVIESINQVESDTNALDLKELDLSYPQVNWEIRY